MPREPMSLQAEFDGFIVSLWPDPRCRPYPAGGAYEALRKAFFGGCVVAYTHDFRMDLVQWREQLLRTAASETEAVQ